MKLPQAKTIIVMGVAADTFFHMQYVHYCTVGTLQMILVIL